MALKELKQELINQKKAIEAKGGKVEIANSNPSPSEITAGINSITMPDFGNVTATASDVVKDKSFYNASGELEQGTYEDLLRKYYFRNSTSSSNGEVLEFRFDDSYTQIRPYLFHNVLPTINLWLSPETTHIGEYALNNKDKMYIKNWSELTKLDRIRDYALYYAKGIDATIMPDSLAEIGKYGLAATATPEGITFPKNVKILDTYALAQSRNNPMEKLTFPETVIITSFPDYLFYGCSFSQDVVFPNGITNMGKGLMQEGGAPNITLPSQLKSIGKDPFTCSLITNKIVSLTFLGETPPTLEGKLFSSKYYKIINIYVPDTAVDAYKAALSDYLIVPMSQKP